MNRQVLAAIVLAGGVVASNIAPAAAIQYQNNTVYKAMEGSSEVVVFSGTAGSRISVNMGSSPRPVARLAGSCGEVRISPPSSGDFTGLQVDGTSVDASSLPVQTLPSCVSSSFSESRSSNFKTPTGQVVIVGKTPGTAVAVSLPTASTRTVSINACGFGILKASSGQTLPSSFTVGTTNYDISTLPNATSAPFCRTVNGTPYGYVPASWTP